jgi:hypothetical protein
MEGLNLLATDRRPAQARRWLLDRSEPPHVEEENGGAVGTSGSCVLFSGSYAGRLTIRGPAGA